MDNVETSETFTMRQVRQMLGVPASTVRYYCRHGLVPGVRRMRTGYRIFSVEQCDWIRTLVFLRRIGFTVKDMKVYARLCRKGRSTMAERKAMLTTKKRQLRQTLEDLNEDIDFIERREELFDGLMNGKSTADSQWI